MASFGWLTIPEIQAVRGKIIDACVELLDVGAPIRPLFLADQRIGWVEAFTD